jgi:hypothetical protein
VFGYVHTGVNLQLKKSGPIAVEYPERHEVFKAFSDFTYLENHSVLKYYSILERLEAWYVKHLNDNALSEGCLTNIEYFYNNNIGLRFAC